MAAHTGGRMLVEVIHMDLSPNYLLITVVTHAVTETPLSILTSCHMLIGTLTDDVMWRVIFCVLWATTYSKSLLFSEAFAIYTRVRQSR